MSASDMRVIIQHSFTQLCVAPLCGAQQHHLLGCLLPLAPVFVFGSINSSCCSVCFSSRQLAGQSAAFACKMGKSSATATMTQQQPFALPGKLHGLGALECLSCLVPYSGCSIPLFHADACKLFSCDMQSKATYRIAVGVHGLTHEQSTYRIAVGVHGSIHEQSTYRIAVGVHGLIHEQSNAWTKSQNRKLIVTIELK